ncbi:MAG: hydroxymethylbilane synthase [Gammaproteobacteria bacterium]|nr:hydroxymethylbilane synthase [Gammaproteobacteria bacterium]
MIKHIVIATRESPLALQQAESVKDLLLKYQPQLSVALLGITTQADKRLDITLTEIGGKGLFVKELEEALLDKRADIAVHSMKDVPMELPPGLIVPVMLAREDARDAFVSNHYAALAQLPLGARIGTSSLRRQTQLRAQRPDLLLQNLRGNIHTRLHRLDQGDFDAIILASAGLKRMQLTQRIRDYLPIEYILPAAGQGALGVECRAEDKEIQALLTPLHDAITFNCVSAERALCRRLGGGCKVPVAAFAQQSGEMLHLQALVANYDGTLLLQAKREGHISTANKMGIDAAEDLLAQGAENILQAFL